MKDNRVRAALILGITIVLAAFLLRPPRYEFHREYDFQYDPRGGHMSTEAFYRYDVRSGKLWTACTRKYEDAGICRGWVPWPTSKKLLERLKEPSVPTSVRQFPL